MLALEVCLAEGSREEHTFLFDEVDAGVGGRAALAVGKRLASLAADRQVIVVTHLPQVAAYAGTQAVVRRQEGEQGASTDVVVVDTAGRLQNKSGLMDELGKIKRVMERNAPVGEVLLVLDATTGQNGMRQAQVFGEVTGITGIVLTKLDGTAKGGIVVSVQRELEVPVKLVGLGEGADDLAPFDPEGFVDALLQEKPA